MSQPKLAASRTIIRRSDATTHYRPYQLECPTCREVAALHLRADLLRPHISRLAPRPSALIELSPKQRIAADWTSAVANCLRLGMAAHSRCGTCTILMGPGHDEPGVAGFCGTHSDAPPLVLPAASEDTSDVLAWIAGNRGAAA